MVNISLINDYIRFLVIRSIHGLVCLGDVFLCEINGVMNILGVGVFRCFVLRKCLLYYLFAINFMPFWSISHLDIQSNHRIKDNQVKSHQRIALSLLQK